MSPARLFPVLLLCEKYLVTAEKGYSLSEE